MVKGQGHSETKHSSDEGITTNGSPSIRRPFS